MSGIAESASFGARVDASMVMNPGVFEEMRSPRFIYEVECVRDGIVIWTERFVNLVTTQGKTDIIDKYFKGSSYTAAWYLGLKGTGTAVVGDTLASHASWSEVNPYTGNRPAITFGTTSGGSNTATAVGYTITVTGPTTVAGAFVANANTGTSGVLYSAGDFALSRSVTTGDQLNVTLTVSGT